MGKPEFSSSEPYLPPKTLAERLKAQANGLVDIEAASFMAERFAPDLQTQATSEPELDASPEPAEDVRIGHDRDLFEVHPNVGLAGGAVAVEGHCPRTPPLRHVDRSMTAR